MVSYCYEEHDRSTSHTYLYRSDADLTWEYHIHFDNFSAHLEKQHSYHCYLPATAGQPLSDLHSQQDFKNIPVYLIDLIQHFQHNYSRQSTLNISYQMAPQTTTSTSGSLAGNSEVATPDFTAVVIALGFGVALVLTIGIFVTVYWCRWNKRHKMSATETASSKA